jgi:L-lactate dehydrogenase
MIDVTVIGFGNVGSSLSLLLLNNKHDIRLNVMEPDAQREGAFLDLSHGMTLYPNKELATNDEDLFSNADFVFYTAGTPNVHGGSRLSTAKQNIKLTKEIFEGRRFVKTPYVVVITNPVDIVSHSVFQYSELPSSHVIGTGTFLDSVRLAYYLSTLSDYHADNIDAFVLGEHGESQVATYSMTTVHGQPISEYSEFTKFDLETAKDLTRNAAFQIRETQKGTTYGVSKCAEVLMDYLLGDEEHILTLSVLTNDHYRQLLDLDHDIYISVPVKVSSKGVEPVDEISLASNEFEALKESARILAEIIE